MDQATITTIVLIIALVVVFVIARELFCWYWKINKRIALMEEQNKLLKTLIKLKKSELKDMSEDSDTPDDSDKLNENTAKEITVKHLESQRVERISMAYWKKMKKEHGEASFKIIGYHE